MLDPCNLSKTLRCVFYGLNSVHAYNFRLITSSEVIRPNCPIPLILNARLMCILMRKLASTSLRLKEV